MRIGIVDDNYVAVELVQEQLKLFVDIKIIHIAFSGFQLLELLNEDADIDILLMDLGMKPIDGIETTKLVKTQFPKIKIVVLTVYNDDVSILNAIYAGANSYMLKGESGLRLYECLIDTFNGGSVMSASIANRTLLFLRSISTNEKKINLSADWNLSQREIEILEQIEKGIANKKIAENLFISPFTVKRHIENIYRKLRARNRVELLALLRGEKITV